MPTTRPHTVRPWTTAPAADRPSRARRAATLAATLACAVACTAQAAPPQIVVEAQAWRQGGLWGQQSALGTTTPVRATTQIVTGPSTGYDRDWIGALNSPIDCAVAAVPVQPRCIAWDLKTFGVARGSAADFDLAVGLGGTYNDQANVLYRITATGTNDGTVAKPLQASFHITGAEVRFDGIPYGTWASTALLAEVTAEASWYSVSGGVPTLLGHQSIAAASVGFDVAVGPLRAQTSLGGTPGGGILVDADQDFGVAIARLPAFMQTVPMGLVPAGETWRVVYDVRAAVYAAGPVIGAVPRLTAFIGDPFSISAAGGAAPAFDVGLAAPVPEPAAWSTLLAGLFLVAALARRMR